MRERSKGSKQASTFMNSFINYWSLCSHKVTEVVHQISHDCICPASRCPIDPAPSNNTGSGLPLTENGRGRLCKALLHAGTWPLELAAPNRLFMAALGNCFDFPAFPREI